MRGANPQCVHCAEFLRRWGLEGDDLPIDLADDVAYVGLEVEAATGVRLSNSEVMVHCLKVVARLYAERTTFELAQEVSRGHE